MTDQAAFEALLSKVATRLGDEVRQSTIYHAPDAFQRRVFDLMAYCRCL